MQDTFWAVKEKGERGIQYWKLSKDLKNNIFLLLVVLQVVLERREKKKRGFQMEMKRDPEGVSFVGERNRLKVLGSFDSG